jgi:hypothetical protein
LNEVERVGRLVDHHLIIASVGANSDLSNTRGFIVIPSAAATSFRIFYLFQHDGRAGGRLLNEIGNTSSPFFYYYYFLLRRMKLDDAPRRNLTNGFFFLTQQQQQHFTLCSLFRLK